jgi:CRISPR-associated endonuclease/helicase Cas3
MNRDEFDACFAHLTGCERGPFPWQQALFAKFQQKQFPDTCDIPTGLGKTSIMAIWLLTLAHHARIGALAGFPRRLVYVVNRRTVVDQATREAEQMREALASKLELLDIADAVRGLSARPAAAALAISTLRGQFADNAEWRDDPARPSVVVGTVDMIGSRLLFSGYGRGFKSRPLHAGFLGQDTLLVHDEAHLEPAFQQLIDAIEDEQRRCRDFGKFRVMALTATARSGDDRFQLSDADLRHDVVRQRIHAKKGIKFCPVGDEKKTADGVFLHALRHKDGNQAILIFLRKLDHVEKVKDELSKANQATQMLTGTMRGLERDTLATTDPIFARFMPKPAVTPKSGTVYLVCTSAGEVGVNISADHLVCDLTPFDSMTQRFGRVNRFGEGDAHIDVVHVAGNRATTAQPSAAASEDASGTDSHSPNDATGDEQPNRNAKAPSEFDQACARTLPLLRRLPEREDQRHNASPYELGELPLSDRLAAFTPSPVILPATDVLFDAWALTSVREKLPGCPMVTDWLHGVAEWEPPETHVAWREEVENVTGELLTKYKPVDLLEDYPLKPHELLRDHTWRVFDHLEKLAARSPELPVWLVDSDGTVRTFSLQALVERNKQKRPVVSLDECTVLLPPAVGGLQGGMLSGAAIIDESLPYDVADRWMDQDAQPGRGRVWDGEDAPRGMRLVRTIDVRADTDGEDGEEQATGRRYWRWYARPRSADDDGSRSARHAQDLEPHLRSAEAFASAIVTKLELSEGEATAVVSAARWHDLGKDRAIWQRSIGNRDPGRVLAKSGPEMRPIELTTYRHEFGSLIDVETLPSFRDLDSDTRDLVLHLIAAHHGRARPHFPEREAFDPENSDERAGAIAREVPRRFGRLQRKYGRWGLAYLESLVRAADALASQSIPSNQSRQGTVTTTRPEDDRIE